MLLHQKIGEIFLEDEGARTTFSNSLKRFLVLDSTCRQHFGESGVVLLVESPHIHEVRYRYPLAGNTGIHVRDVLGKNARRLFPNEPIGRSVYDGHLDFLRLGIMNVSQLPFRRDTYDCLPVRNANDCQNHEHWTNYKNYMNTIKNGPCVSSDNREIDECKKLDKAITKDLKRRLRILHRRNHCVLLVRCGPVAQEFYRKTGINMPNACDLPHPARRPKRITQGSRTIQRKKVG